MGRTMCAVGSTPTTLQVKIEDEIMKYSNPIGAMCSALNGTTICVAAIRELWAKPENGGDFFAVHSIVDETEPDAPWYDVYVTDYRGNRYDFCTLARESQCELCEIVIGILTSNEATT